MGLYTSTKNIVKSILSIDNRKKVYTPLDPDLIKKDETVKALAQKVQAQESQLAKYKAKDKERVDKLKERDKESEQNKQLKEQALDLQANKYGKITSLNKFYNDLLVVKRWKKKPIQITDKNYETVLGEFGDIVILEGGKLGIRDNKKNLLAYGSKLNQIFHKPDAFQNMVRRGIIAIPMDKDGNWIEDVEYQEVPEPLDQYYDEDSGKLKIRWSKVKTSEVKKVIARIVEEKNDAMGELERVESTLIKLKLENDDLKMTLNTYRTNSEVAGSNLSQAIFKVNEMEKRFSDIHSENMKLMEMKSTYEGIIEAQRNVIERIKDKLDLTGDPKVDRERERIKDELEWARSILPEKVEIKQEAPPMPMPITQPGEVIKR
jgi:hypothetical protein